MKAFRMPVLFLCTVCACSLDYQQDSSAEESVPEFSFSGGSFSRYEKGTRRNLLEAQRFEQYKNDPAVYGRGVAFRSWDDTGELQAEGSCGTLSADQDHNNYTLFDSIILNDVKNGTEIRAEKLRYNGETEQLTSGRDDYTTIVRDDISISGRGFSASGISRSFSFADSVEGMIVTDDGGKEEELPPEEGGAE